MALFEWNDDLLVGVVEIDDQHQRLVTLINMAHDNIAEPDQAAVKNKMKEILEELFDYTEAHFCIEEYLMGLHEYPESAAHLEEHSSFIKKIRQLEEDFNENRDSVHEDTSNFLKDWLYNHIMKVDKALGKYLNSKGVY